MEVENRGSRIVAAEKSPAGLAKRKDIRTFFELIDAYEDRS